MCDDPISSIYAAVTGRNVAIESVAADVVADVMSNVSSMSRCRKIVCIWAKFSSIKYALLSVDFISHFIIGAFRLNGCVFSWTFIRAIGFFFLLGCNLNGLNLHN